MVASRTLLANDWPGVGRFVPQRIGGKQNGRAAYDAGTPENRQTNQRTFGFVVAFVAAVFSEMLFRTADTPFTPVQIELINVPADTARVKLTYSSSSPSEIEATLDDPFVLPAGLARLWSRDGIEPRSALPLSEGGDFIDGGRGNDLINGGTGADVLIETLAGAAWDVDFVIQNNLLVTLQKDPSPTRSRPDQKPGAPGTA